MRGFWRSSSQADADAISHSRSAHASRPQHARSGPRMQESASLRHILWPRKLKNHRKKGSRFGGRFWAAVRAILNIILISRQNTDPKTGSIFAPKIGPTNDALRRQPGAHRHHQYDPNPGHVESKSQAACGQGLGPRNDGQP